MRFLLVAYDFPPIPSPQSLRWAYLANELAEAGHDVHVLAPDIEGYGAGGLPAPHAKVHVHRVWPGPFSAWKTWRLRRRRVPSSPSGSASAGVAMAPEPSKGRAAALNWKGRLRHNLRESLRIGPVAVALGRRCGLDLQAGGNLMDLPRSIAELWLYPDIRAEWWPWARWKLLRLLARVRPDFVITSHEPANSLPLGLLAHQKGYRWVADLGDPVLSPYTPERWRKRAESLERAVCAGADLITVTAARARDILVQRHRVPPDKFMIATQGHGGLPTGSEAGTILFDQSRLELFYAGSFYSFRKPDELISAVVRANGVRLNVASINPPPELIEAAREYPGSIRLLGFVPHAAAIQAQRECDLLVNLANTDPIQVPGKLFEYLGAGRPILHIGSTGEDESAKIILGTNSGWNLPNSRQLILDFLGNYEKKKGEELMGRRDRKTVDEYSWKSVAHRLVSQLQRMEAMASRTGNPQQHMRGA